MNQESDTSVQANQTKEHSNNKDSVNKNKDRWDKADIIFRSLGAFATAAVVAVVGIFGSNFLAKRQERETNLRLYTELMSRREDADTALRKEMFGPLINDFLRPSANQSPEGMLLSLELLAHNFHDSLDLGPLFKVVLRRLEEAQPQNRNYIDRLRRVARDVIDKQVTNLAKNGGKRDTNIIFEELNKQPGGLTVIDSYIQLESEDPNQEPIQKQVRMEVLGANLERQELTIRLIVRKPPDTDELDAVFRVGFFDFPLVDNLRLPNGWRCAVVLNAFDREYADFTFVYFDGSRGSFKESEVLYKLRKPEN
jgi:hypothetical protein